MMSQLNNSYMHLQPKVASDSASSSRHKSTPSPNLQPELLPKSFALLQTLEELLQDAYNNGIDTDALFFGPSLQRQAGR